MRLAAVGPEAADALAEVHAQAFDRPWTRDDIAALLQTPATVALTADEGGEVLGFIMLHKAADEAEVSTLAVRTDARRHGVARALVEGACALLSTAGAHTLWLEVAVDNPAATALYAAVGFSAAGRRPRYYDRGNGERVDALLMRRQLNSPKA